MDVDEEPAEEVSEDSDADNENDSKEAKALKVCHFSIVILRIGD